jgi:hypothetical protein
MLCGDDIQASDNKVEPYINNEYLMNNITQNSFLLRSDQWRAREQE